MKKTKNFNLPTGMSEGAVQKGLMNIYSNKDGSLPDISHLEVRRKSRLKIFFISFVALAVILSGIAWLGFLLLNPNGKFSNESIKLTIESQQSIASGDEVIYVVKYKNTEKIPLDDVEMIVRYPDGFQFSSAQPQANNEFNTVWNLGTLDKNQTGQIEIKGRLIGEVGSLQIISATASYRPENFSSSFKESQSFTSQITSSILELSVEGPDKILPEKKLDYKIHYKNNSDQKLENIRVQVQYMDNFVFQQSTPEPFSREDDARKLNNQWVIDSLDAKQEGEIVITGGYLAKDNTTDVTFGVQLGFYQEDTDEFSLQQEKTITTLLIQPKLELNLIINGSTTDKPISFDQPLTYSITYKNAGEADLDDVSISASLNSDILDWSSLDDKNKGTVTDKTITWTKDEISNLDLLRPGDSGTIDFSIRSKTSAKVNPAKDSLQLISKAFATLAKVGDLAIEDLSIESQEIKNNINTDLELNVTARYFDDDNIAVGTGPLPPVVGQKTTFRIYWAIANSLSPVKDVKVTTILPDGIDWENKFLAKTGSISYSSASHQITWTMNNLAAGKNFNDTAVWFDVSVVPTKQQERKLIILTDQTTLTATDPVSKTDIKKTGKATTSNLEDDPVGGGRGLVVDISD